MKFFIDTANLDQIREAYDMGVLDRSDYQPFAHGERRYQRSGKPAQTLRGYLQYCAGRRQAEVIATDYEGMIKEGEELAALNPHIVVKVPCIADGIKAIKYLLWEKAFVPTARWCFP